jgi:hypothetical protein
MLTEGGTVKRHSRDVVIVFRATKVRATGFTLPNFSFPHEGIRMNEAFLFRQFIKHSRKKKDTILTNGSILLLI